MWGQISAVSEIRLLTCHLGVSYLGVSYGRVHLPNVFLILLAVKHHKFDSLTGIVVVVVVVVVEVA